MRPNIALQHSFSIYFFFFFDPQTLICPKIFPTFIFPHFNSWLFTQSFSLTDFQCAIENFWRSYHASNKYICRQKRVLNYNIASAYSLLLKRSPNIPECCKWFFSWSKFPFYMLLNLLTFSPADYWSLCTIRVSKFKWLWIILPQGNRSGSGGSLVSNVPFPEPKHPSTTQEWVMTCP